MSTQVFTYDIFLSYALADREVAEDVKQTFHGAGLDVTDPIEISMAAGDEENEVRRALAEADAMVVIANPDRPFASRIGVEVGGAWAWQKPIYVVKTGIRDAELPTFLNRFPCYQLSNIDDLAIRLVSDLKPLSEEDRKYLIKAYERLGIPADQLLLKPFKIERLAEYFQEESGRGAAGERLTQELVRMRKSGILPKFR